MSTTTTRFLQQEQSRLQRENEALKQKNVALQRYLNLVEELYWKSRQIAAAEQPLLMLDDLLGKAIDVVGATDGSIACLDETKNELVFALVHGNLRSQLPGFRFPGDSGIAGWVVEHKKPIIVNNPRQDWRFYMEIDQGFSFSTRSIVSVPILAEAQPIGVISLLNKKDNIFTPADVALLLILNQVAATALTVAPSELKTPKHRPATDDLFAEE